VRYSLALPGAPLLASRLPLVGSHTVALTPLGLQKGDRVRFALEATDYRGQNDSGNITSATAFSEPILLEISDESGVLAAIAEADQRSEQRLNEIIKRQLGTGASSGVQP
jgi:hypothetical protein